MANPATQSAEATATPLSNQGLIDACAAAVNELKYSRIALEKQGVLIEKQKQLLNLEREISEAAKDIGNLSARQIEQLNVALAKKDSVISELENQNQALKKKPDPALGAPWNLRSLESRRE